MTIESTRGLRAWSRFWLAAAVTAVLLAAACSGSSSGLRHRLPGGSTTAGNSTFSPGTFPSGGPTPVRPGTAPTKVVVVPRSIDPTGQRDDTKVLQVFLDRVPDDRLIQFRAGGRYRIDGTLFLANRHRLTIDGKNALFFAGTRGGRNRAQWWIRDGSQIVFRNVWVKGANPNGGVSTGAYVRKLETQHGFHFEGVDGAELDHVRVTDVFGDFVYLGRDTHRVPSRNVWIHDSTFLRNGRQGIAVTAATNVIIEHNSFDDTRRSTIDLEPNARSWHVSNVFVLDNTVGKGRLLFVASHGQGPVNNIVISGNRLIGHPLTIDVAAPGKQRRSNWVVTNNVSDTVVRSRPMRFSGIDGLDVSGNVQRVAGRQPGVVIANDCGSKVSSNQFGSGGVRQQGAPCTAALAVPTEPPLLGRGISTTTVPPVTTPRPSTTPGPTSPTPATPGSHGGSNPWFAVIVTACVLIAVALVVLGRRRRRNGRET